MSDCVFCSACGGLAVACQIAGVAVLVHAETSSRCFGGYAAVAVWADDVASLETIPEVVRI